MNVPAQVSQSLVDRLFGLSRLSWFDSGVYLGWSHALPAWLWAAIVLSAVAFSCWSYGRIMGSRHVRIGLAAVRGLLLVLITALIAGPQLVRPEEKLEPDCLIVLIDRSASMQIADAADEAGLPVSRDEALRRQLAKQTLLFGPEVLAKDRNIAWFGFGGQAFEITPNALPEANAQHTEIRTAIEQSLRTAAGAPISGVVLMTDGRSPQDTGAELVRRLQQQAVSVFSVPLGASQLPLDLSIVQVDAPRRAFVNDIVPINVMLECRGGSDSAEAGPIQIRLVNAVDEQVLAHQTVGADDLDRPVRLTGQSPGIGEAKWRVEVEFEADHSEWITTNNQRDIAIELIDRPLRVLYIEGYPRWEYRYLKNLLVREQSIASSVILLSADRAFAQEGDVPIVRPPSDAEEIDDFDVIILGDVASDTLTAKQGALLRDHVALRGAGFLWIAGSQSTPRAYDGSPLAELLPMRHPGSVGRYIAQRNSRLQPTALARTLSVLRLRGPETGDTDWPVKLPPLHWVQNIGSLKPTADVLAHAPDAEQLPLVVRLRYGAGQSIYVATDETWRWRYGRGELYFEQFWIQLVRMLGRGRLQLSASDRARLVVSNRRVGLGQPVVVDLQTFDSALLSRQLGSLAVEVVDGNGNRVDQFELRPAGSADAPTDPRRRAYTATWRPAVSGQLVLRITEAALDELNISASVEVVAADDELRQLEPDHARLALLSEQTGGQVVPLDELAILADAIPNRARKTPADIREPLWHSPVALVLILALLTMEWIVRKVIRLV